MRSHVTKSRASAVLLAITLAIAPACENEPATVGEPSPSASAPSKSARPESAATDESAAPEVAAPVASTTPDRVTPSKPAPVAEVAPPKEIVWMKGTLEEALAQAKKQDKLVFIDFWTTWCGWCKKLDHDTYTDPKIIASLNEHYVCLSIDAESKEGAPIARRYSVNGYPTLLFLTTDGLVRERVPGYKPPEKLLPILEATAKPR
jgi:thiol-disulfide isomerase/thioredoxin